MGGHVIPLHEDERIAIKLYTGKCLFNFSILSHL